MNCYILTFVSWIEQLINEGNDDYVELRLLAEIRQWFLVVGGAKAWTCAVLSPVTDQ